MFHFSKAEFPPIWCSRFTNYCLIKNTNELNWEVIPQPLENHQLPLPAFPLTWAFARARCLVGHRQSGTPPAGHGGERCRLRNPFLGLWCSIQNLGRKGRWPGQWWNQWHIRAISDVTPTRRGDWNREVVLTDRYFWSQHTMWLQR